MHNLLRSPLTESELFEILKQTPEHPRLPLYGDAKWQIAAAHPLFKSINEALVRTALNEADEPMPPLSDELYADFHKTGNRLNFERPYFERRRRLSRAAMALLIGEPSQHDRLLPSFLAKLEDILGEDSWSLPAHVWENTTGKDPMVIDLFAAECVHNLSEILIVFESLIPERVSQRIRDRLKKQIFLNYAEREPAFHWTRLPMNWNAVCHQGVIGAALAIETDLHLVARMLRRMSEGLPAFLDGFGDDGSTSEGPGYWSYGFGWFADLNASLEHRTEGRLSLFEGNAKVARIARFAPMLTLAGGHLVNFSDGHHNGHLNASMITYLGQRLHDPLLRDMGAYLYQELPKCPFDIDEPRRDFLNLTRLFLRAPSPSLADTKPPALPDALFPDYGAIVARGTDRHNHFWEFAAKAGHNAEHHNHNDCGSFLLNIDHTPTLIEIGSPEYVRDFFSDRHRYQFLAARSLGHSVPLVNGCEQFAGADAAARVIEVTGLDDDRVGFKIDLTRCYPAEARCTKLVREFQFIKSEGVLHVSDTVTLSTPGTFETMLISHVPFVIDGATALLETGSLKLKVIPAEGSRITLSESCPYRGHKGDDATACRLRLSSASASGTSLKIGYSVRLES